MVIMVMIMLILKVLDQVLILVVFLVPYHVIVRLVFIRVGLLVCWWCGGDGGDFEDGGLTGGSIPIGS